MKIELTDRHLRNLRPPSNGRIEVSDTKRPGLRLRLYSSGKAVWMFEKRVKGGAKRKHTFGTWPEPISLSEARKLALEIEAEAVRGFDRVEEARQSKLLAEQAQAQLKSLQSVLDTYAELHLSTLRTGAKRKQQLEVALSDYLVEPITNLTRADLQSVIDAKAKEGRKVSANRIRAALKAFASWAWGRNYLDSNIGDGLAKASRETVRERLLTIGEIREIWEATFQLGELWGPVFRLFLLTVQRRGEILGLRLEEVELDRARIVKPGSQTKNDKAHITHLSEPALAELRGAIERAGREAKSARWNPEFVFSTTGTTPISGISRAKARLDKILGDKVGPWRIHDIRTAFATAMAEANVPETVADRVLNHVAGGSAPSAVSRVYNRSEMLPQRAAALDRWAEMVTQESAEIVNLGMKQ